MTRLETIASRQRALRLRDLLFALFIALVALTAVASVV